MKVEHYFIVRTSACDATKSYEPMASCSLIKFLLILFKRKLKYWAESTMYQRKNKFKVQINSQ